MSNIITKIPYRITPAFFMGWQRAMRWTWMQDARRFKSEGKADMVAQCVTVARRHNHETIHELQRLRALGGV